jgi:hypothetical protein
MPSSPPRLSFKERAAQRAEQLIEAGGVALALQSGGADGTGADPRAIGGDGCGKTEATISLGDAGSTAAAAAAAAAAAVTDDPMTEPQPSAAPPKRFKWREVRNEVRLWFKIPCAVKAKDVRVEFKSRSLSMGVVGEAEERVTHATPLLRPVAAPECYWEIAEISGARHVRVILVKAMNSVEPWPVLFQQEEAAGGTAGSGSGNGSTAAAAAAAAAAEALPKVREVFSAGGVHADTRTPQQKARDIAAWKRKQSEEETAGASAGPRDWEAAGASADVGHVPETDSEFTSRMRGHSGGAGVGVGSGSGSRGSMSTVRGADGFLPLKERVPSFAAGEAAALTAAHTAATDRDLRRLAEADRGRDLQRLAAGTAHLALGD